MGELVLPGERIGRRDNYQVGTGVYEYREALYSCLAGYVHIETADEEHSLPTLSVMKGTTSSIIPTTNSEVIAQVTRVFPKRIDCKILCVEGIPVSDPFKGIIRLQDVREYEVDKLNMIECFRPTDIVRCNVVSMGDSRSYLLSTAGLHYGVIYGRSESGWPLQPISWKYMRCSKTGELELRKVACPKDV